MHTTDRSLELLGLLATLVTVGFVAIGGWALVTTYALESPTGSLAGPIAATLLLTVAVVVGLSVLGVRSSRRLENPYW